MEAEPTSELIRTQLRRLRVNAELSQEEFGKLVHYSGSQVSAVELGQRPLDRLFLKRADEVLNTGGLLTSLLKMTERAGQPSWLDRQSILDQPQPPQLVAVLEETVLRRADESFRGLMIQQIAHLLDCAERPQVSVHVIPTEISSHVGLAGPFTLARSEDGGWVGYLEHQLGGTSVDKDEDVSILLARWESVRSEALPHRQSVELMKEVMTSWS
ncbi:helix-turn-helix transcriptional regulator [Micromonospora sp. NPDC047707]|uniref:helix-turn-helix domain-containing protein n=1 Tax=Micromonospora sp. NPDC047707 TaxID=3154498 RepID=UPI0034525B61